MAADDDEICPFGNEGKGASSAKGNANVDLPRKERIQSVGRAVEGDEICVDALLFEEPLVLGNESQDTAAAGSIADPESRWGSCSLGVCE